MRPSVLQTHAPLSSRGQSLLALALFTVTCLTAACVTINVYFPEAAIKDLSQQIEAAVAAEAAKATQNAPAAEESPATSDEDGSAEGGQLQVVRHTAERAIGYALHWLLPADSVAAQDDVAAPEISNPAIRKIIESRGQRAPALRQLKNQGVVGENNQALVEVRQLDALALQERAAAQKLIKEENEDRQRMFKEIAAATGTDLSQLPQIQSTYAETLRQKAKSGDWVQMANGTWQQKG